MQKLYSNKLYIAVFVLPAFLAFVCIGIIPLFITGYYGLFDYDGIGEKTFLGLQNYINLFTNDPEFIKAILNSFILAAASLFIQLPLSFILAVILSKGVKGEGFFRTIYFVPVVISSMVIGQLFIRIFNSEGLFNGILGLVGIHTTQAIHRQPFLRK